MISMMRMALGASIVASFDPSELMRTAQAFISGAMENKAARWIMLGSFMVLLVEIFARGLIPSLLGWRGMILRFHKHRRTAQFGISGNRT